MVDLTLTGFRVVIRPGTGIEGNDWSGYPASTETFVDELTKVGAFVEYETSEGPDPVLELRSVDLLLPVIQFAADVGAEVVATGVVAALGMTAKKLGWRKSDNVTLPLQIARKSGATVSIRIKGTPDAVACELREIAELLDQDDG